MANSLSALYNYDVFRAELLYQLRQKLAMVGLVNRNYQNLVMTGGDTASIGLMDIVGPAHERAIGQATQIDDARSRKKTVKFTNLYKAVRFDNLEHTLSDMNLLLELARRLAVRVSEGADSRLTGLHSKIPYEVGTTDGTPAFAADRGGIADTLAAADQILIDNMIPTDEAKHAIFNSKEQYAARTDPQYKVFMNSGDPNFLRTGQLQPIHGFNPRAVQRVGSAQYSSAAEWGNAPAAAAAAVLGATQVSLSGLGVGTLRDGSTFTIAGHVNDAESPIGYAVQGDTVIAGNAAVVTIFPPLAALLVGNEVVTPKPHTAATPAGIGLAFHPDAFMFAVRPQAPLSGMILSETINDPDSGLAFRLHVESKAASANAGEAFSDTITIDILCAFELLREEFAVKITGKK